MFPILNGIIISIRYACVRSDWDNYVTLLVSKSVEGSVDVVYEVNAPCNYLVCVVSRLTHSLVCVCETGDYTYIWEIVKAQVFNEF